MDINAIQHILIILIITVVAFKTGALFRKELTEKLGIDHHRQNLTMRSKIYIPCDLNTLLDGLEIDEVSDTLKWIPLMRIKFY